jgi:fructokinase
MTRYVVALGEILFDLLPVEQAGVVQGFTLHPGGGPFNVAVGLARLGLPTAFVSQLGDDFFGRRLREVVRAEGIADIWLPTAPGRSSTLAFVAHENGEPAFTFYGEGAADTLLTPATLPLDLFDQTQLLHFGGISLLRGTTPEAALVAAETLRGRALVSLDPNVRPALIRDAAAYRATLARAIAACDILKISAADTAWLAPGSDLLAYAADQLAHGPALVLVTRGGDGVTALRQTDHGVERIDVPGFAVQVADTVGAGDSFSGGVLAALVRQQVTSRAALTALASADLRTVLRYGAAVAAITCSRPGADPPRSAEVEVFLREQGAGSREQE